MVDRNLLATLSVEDEQAWQMIADEFGDTIADGDLDQLLEGQIQDFKPGTILKGRVIGKAGDDFLVEVGLKSEGILDRNEFDDATTVEIGDVYEVLLEDVEGDVRHAVLVAREDRVRRRARELHPSLLHL